MGYRKICNKAKTGTHLNKSNFMLFYSFSFFLRANRNNFLINKFVSYSWTENGSAMRMNMVRPP